MQVAEPAVPLLRPEHGAATPLGPLGGIGNPHTLAGLQEPPARLDPAELYRRELRPKHRSLCAPAQLQGERRHAVVLL